MVGGVGSNLFCFWMWLWMFLVWSVCCGGVIGLCL